MSEPKAVIEVLQELIESWPVVHVSVVQDKKRRYLPLVKVQDQSVVLKYVTDKLHEYRQTLKKGEPASQPTEAD